jgi:hypothetical protein
MHQDGTAAAVPIGMFTDEKMAIQARDERNAGLSAVLSWSLVGPEGQMGVALNVILSSFGLKAVNFDVMSAEPQGAILTPAPKIILPH